MAAKQSTGNVDAKGAGVHSLRHDEPDGCGVGVPHELRSQVLQGEGGDAVGFLLRIVTAKKLPHNGHTYMQKYDILMALNLSDAHGCFREFRQAV